MASPDDQWELDVCIDCRLYVGGNTVEGHELLPLWRNSHLFGENRVEEFSTSKCDGCGSRIGGERWRVIATDTAAERPTPGDVARAEAEARRVSRHIPRPDCHAHQDCPACELAGQVFVDTLEALTN